MNDEQRKLVQARGFTPTENELKAILGHLVGEVGRWALFQPEETSEARSVAVLNLLNAAGEFVRVLK